MSRLALLALIVGVIVVVGLLVAVASFARRPPDMRRSPRDRRDLWGDNQPLDGGNYAEDARVVADAEDAAERARLEALLDAKNSNARLTGEWLAAQAQIRQTWSG